MAIDQTPQQPDAERHAEMRKFLTDKKAELRTDYKAAEGGNISSRFELLNNMARNELLYTYNQLEEELKKLQEQYPDPDELEKREEYKDLIFRAEMMQSIGSHWIEQMTSATGGVINAESLPLILRHARKMRDLMTKKEQSEIIEVATYILGAELPKDIPRTISKDEQAFEIMISHLNARPENREYIGMLVSFMSQQKQTDFVMQYVKNVDNPKEALLALNEFSGLPVRIIEAAIGTKLTDEEATNCTQKYNEFNDYRKISREIARTPFGSEVTGDQLTGPRILGTILTISGGATVLINTGVNIKEIAKRPTAMTETHIPTGIAMIAGGKLLLSKKKLKEILAGKEKRDAQAELNAQILLLDTLNGSPRGWDPFLAEKQNLAAIDEYLKYLNGEIGDVSHQTISLKGFQQFLAKPENTDRFAGVAKEIKRLTDPENAGAKIGVTERNFKELVWSFDVLGINGKNYTEKVEAAMEVA